MTGTAERPTARSWCVFAGPVSRGATTRRVFSSVLCILLLACATADVMRLEQQPRPPTKPADIQVFLDEPTRPYTSIAMVQASDQGFGLSLDALKTKMVERAAALGGDAVIIGQQFNQGAGTYFMPIGNMLYGMNVSEKKLTGKIIVFTPTPSPMTAPTPSPTPSGNATRRTRQAAARSRLLAP